MPLIAPTYTRETALRKVCSVDNQNRFANFLNTLQVDGGRLERPNDDGIDWRIVMDATSPYDNPALRQVAERNEMALDCEVAGSSVRVLAGVIRWHGKGNYAVASDTVALAGAVEWVYVEMDIRAATFGETVTIEHASTEPETDADTLRWPLRKYTFMDGVYVASPANHRGDINVVPALG